MNKTNWINLIALLVLVLAIPLYGFLEDQRMQHAKADLRNRYVMDGIELYVTNCATCHGAAGEGIGQMPALNRSALAEADADMLFRAIARATHGTAMASWHVEEGGILTDYQLKELVALIQHTDWAVVERVAAVRGFMEPVQPAVEYGMTYLETENTDDPHQCVKCHEEPAVHADLFGINCARCHSTVAWKPATLTRHNFLLDHGGKGEVACQTCHPTNYQTYDCYACHENHQPAEMADFHLAEGITEYKNCATCHPTGVHGEADQIRQRENPGQHIDDHPAQPQNQVNNSNETPILAIQGNNP